MAKTCECGKIFQVAQWQINSGRGKYCSKSCLYKYRTRPSGLSYNIVSDNPGWIQPGFRHSPETEFKSTQEPWNKDMKGSHFSVETEFKPGHGYKGGRLYLTYGVTQEQWDNQFDKQNGMCAICFRALIKGKHTHTDHSHSSNKVRGILCSSCNLGLGKFNDDASLLRAAIEYLESEGVWS